MNRAFRLLFLLIVLSVFAGAGCRKPTWSERMALRRKALAEKIEKALKSPEAKLRKWAIKKISGTYSSQWKERLFKLFNSDPDPLVRLEAVKALARKSYGRDLLWKSVIETPKDKDKFFILKILGKLRYSDRKWALKIANGNSYQTKVRLGKMLGEAIKVRSRKRHYKRVRVFGKWRYRARYRTRESKFAMLPFDKTLKEIYRKLVHVGTSVRKALYSVVRRKSGYAQRNFIKAIVDLDITPDYYIKKKMSASAKKYLLEAMTKSTAVSEYKKKEALTSVLNEKLLAAWKALNDASGSTRQTILQTLLESGFPPPKKILNKLHQSVRADLAKVLRHKSLSSLKTMRPVLKTMRSYLWRAVKYIKTRTLRVALLKALFRLQITPSSGFAYLSMDYSMGKVFQAVISALSASEITRLRTYFNIISGYVWKALHGLYRAQGEYLMVLLKKKIPRPKGALKHLHWNNSDRIAKLLDDLPLQKQMELGIRNDVLAVYEQIARNSLKRGKPKKAREYFLRAGKPSAFKSSAVELGEKALKEKNFAKAIALLKAAGAGKKLAEAYRKVSAKYTPLYEEAFKTGRYKEALRYALKSHVRHVRQDRERLTALRDAASELASLKRKIDASKSSTSLSLLAQHMTLKAAAKTPALLEGANKYLLKVYPYLQIISSTFRKLRHRSKKLIRPYLRSFECVKQLLNRVSFRFKKGMARIKLTELKP